MKTYTDRQTDNNPYYFVVLMYSLFLGKNLIFQDILGVAVAPPPSDLRMKYLINRQSEINVH